MNHHQLPAIGAPFEGGFYGGQIRIGDAIFAVVWAPKEAGETSLAWLPKRKDVPGARSCFDSAANTRAMAEADSALGKWALELEIAGHKDWLVPSRDVLELAYRHLKPTTDETGGYFRDGDNPSSVPAGYPYSIDPPQQTGVEDFKEGGAQAFEAEWYWSSTQCSEANAWTQHFFNGTQRGNDKTYEARCRAVRLIRL